MIPKRHILFALALTALALSAAGPAWAEEPPSAVEQYIEQIPSARGPVSPPAGSGSAPASEQPPPLSGEVEGDLAREGGDDAPLLRDIVESPRYGAPTQRLRATPPTARGDGGTLGAAASAASSDGSGWLTAVLVGVPLLTIALIAWRRFAPRS